MKTTQKTTSLAALHAIILSAVALLGSAGLATAASGTFNNTSGGNWLTGSNWSTGNATSATTDTASFANGTYTVTTTGNMTGKLNVLTGQTIELSFGNYTLSADSPSVGTANILGGSLTFSSGIFTSGAGAGSTTNVGFDSSNSSLLVTGSNSTWNLQVAGSRLGRANTANATASNNSITVANGAKYNDTSTGTNVIGQATAASVTTDNNSFTVTGAGSTYTYGGSLNVGYTNNSAASVANNKLIVDNGGNMTMTGSLLVGVRAAGTATTFSNNLVIVGGNGTGSVLTVNGGTGVVIADAGVGDGSGVEVKAGGTINATGGNTTLRAGATNTHLSVDGGTYNAGAKTIALAGSGTSLTLSNNGSVTAATLTVAAGGLLTGSGKVVAATSVSGTFTPGVSSIGTMVLDGSATGSPLLTMNTGAKFSYELGSGLTSDKVNLWNYTGVADFVRNSSVIDITFLAGSTAGTYNLFNFYSDAGTTLTAAGFSSGLSLNFTNGGNGTLDYSPTGQINLVVSAVPEPTTWALLAASLTTVMILRRRRARP